MKITNLLGGLLLMIVLFKIVHKAIGALGPDFVGFFKSVFGKRE